MNKVQSIGSLAKSIKGFQDVQVKFYKKDRMPKVAWDIQANGSCGRSQKTQDIWVVTPELKLECKNDQFQGINYRSNYDHTEPTWEDPKPLSGLPSNLAVILAVTEYNSWEGQEDDYVNEMWLEIYY